MSPDPADHRVVEDDALIRTHLANERTFLAWLRTAVVMVGVGIGAIVIVEGDRAIRVFAITLGGVAAAGGCLLVAWALGDYVDNVTGINTHSFRPARRLPIFATVLTAVVALGAVVLAVLELSRD